MDESLTSRIFTKLGVAILAVALLDLAFVNWVIIKNQKTQKSTTQAISAEKTVEVPGLSQNSSPSPTPLPQAQLKEVGASETKPVIEKETQTIVQTAQKEIFIPMGSGSTTSSTFTDVAGTDVTVDTAKYSQIDSVVFEASIWVVGGNGRAWAQITNVNEKNPLIESQISGISGTGEVKASGKIPFPSDRYNQFCSTCR
ncbi:MAG: hypothetical protein UU34_C0023G0013 [Candidatus Curtissbacteria bacterium GW2011_GWA1_41_11]|uniref:Uncharacterized protein n=1 Tax=Candidatus Curtissbacteria bacterium GW2011_GWA1_41_11 TaxID=1618409 RepID=A0A0G0UAL3_9BACT|nr:MAG: hypothetical protein UU34_C0023G0013 [Candidatus Curtissbacteria bacterium GW2011_GWA1_41_11]